MIPFKSYAEAVAYYQHRVDEQKEKVLQEIKKLRELQATLNYNKKLMEKHEVDNYE